MNTRLHSEVNALSPEQRRLLQKITGYARGNDGANAADGLREALRQHLPEYMIPIIREVPALLVTSNGKLDRKALLATESRDGKGQARPPTLTEARLLRVWERLLRVSVTPTDNFFDVGGNSLLVTGMRALLKEEFGVSIGLREFFTHPTVELLAKHVETLRVDAGDECVIPLTQSRGNRTLVCVHAVDGEAVPFVRLADALGSHFSVVALQRPESLSDEAAEAVKPRALDYVRRLRDVVPQGPYRLLGYSFGGLVALEMARELVAQGAEVAWLGVLDTPLSLTDRANEADSGKGPELALVRAVKDMLALGIELPGAQRLVRNVEEGVRSMQRYVPTPVDVDAHVFRASIDPAVDDASMKAWSATVRRAQFGQLSGRHETLLKPAHVEAVAAAIVAAQTS